MHQAPTGEADAAALLSDACPASRTHLEELAEWWPDFGLLAVINQVVQPLLREVFALPEDLFLNERPVGWVQQPNDPELVATMHQLYLVLELWAQSPNAHITETVWMEFVEGWGGWTPDIITSGPIGPHLLALVSEAACPPRVLDAGPPEQGGPGA